MLISLNAHSEVLSNLISADKESALPMSKLIKASSISINRGKT